MLGTYTVTSAPLQRLEPSTFRSPLVVGLLRPSLVGDFRDFVTKLLFILYKLL